VGVVEERVLAIDLSSKTGWAFMLSSEDSLVLVASGQIPAIHEPPGKYPDTYVLWAYQIFGSILELVERYAPDVLAIEETVAGSKSVYSQKILEFSHALLARMIRETGIKSRYFLTGEWRHIVGAKMTKEEKLRNKEVKAYKAKTGSKLARDVNNKVIGKIGKKQVNVRLANQYFGAYFSKPLIKAQEDMCDALLLGQAYHLEKTRKT
jgi:Holliday junction resolvasome RuvABC endonuclease subunit